MPFSVSGVVYGFLDYCDVVFVIWWGKVVGVGTVAAVAAATCFPKTDCVTSSFAAPACNSCVVDTR